MAFPWPLEGVVPSQSAVEETVHATLEVTVMESRALVPGRLMLSGLTLSDAFSSSGSCGSSVCGSSVLGSGSGCGEQANMRNSMGRMVISRRFMDGSGLLL